MTKWSDLKPDEILKIAVIMEKDGGRFYAQAVELARDLTGRAMFQYLVEEENRHLEVFRRELRELQGVEGAVDPPPQEEERLRRMGGVLEVFGADRGINPGMDETDVLRAAIAIEKDVYLFYRQVSETTDSDKTRTILGRLSEEEWAHYQMLATILSGLADTGRWTPHESVKVAPPPSGGEWSLDEWESSWSIEVGSLYTCENCRSMIMVTKGGVGTLAPECCGKPMVRTSPGGSRGAR